MVFDVTTEFSRIESALAAWVAASGQPSAVTIEVMDAPDTCPSEVGHAGASSPHVDASRPLPRLAARRLGWREGRRTGRFASEREVIAQYLITTMARSAAEADAILARLAATSAEGLQDIAPVPPMSPLWQSMHLTPRPALTVAAAFKLTTAEPAAPAVRDVDARIGMATALEGRVMQGGIGVAHARVGSPGNGRWVRTDHEGRFVLANWSGQPVTVEHRRIRQSFTPATGGGCPADNWQADRRELVLTLPAEE